MEDPAADERSEVSSADQAGSGTEEEASRSPSRAAEDADEVDSASSSDSTPSFSDPVRIQTAYMQR